MLLVAGGSSRIRKGHNRVPILRGVLRKLSGRQLTGAPALVEGVVEDIPAPRGGVDASERVHVNLL
jgi:hypothetical protein